MKYVVIVIIVLTVLFGVQYFINRSQDTTRISNFNADLESAASNSANTSVNNTNMNNSQPSQPSEGLKIEDVVVGTGATATAGKNVTVHYTGRFPNGQIFDSSVSRGEPFTFPLGAGRVIAGWDQGVEGMKVGGKRKLSVPPELGYGMEDYHSIPGGSTLLFDVELLGVQ